MVMKSTLFFVSFFDRFFGLDPTQNPTKTHFFQQDNQSKVSTNLFATNSVANQKQKIVQDDGRFNIYCDCTVLAFEISRVS